MTKLARLSLVIALVLAMSLSQSRQALAYCGGLPTGFLQTFAGGYDTTSIMGVKGYVQGRSVDPVVRGSAAWYMLQAANIFGENWAQSGWARRSGWSTYYVFASWTDPTYGVLEQEKYVTPTLSHNYQVMYLPGPAAFEFSYDTVAWLDTLPNQGWTATEVQVFSESQDSGDHFPGSIGYEALFWGGQKYINGSGWFDLSLTYQITPWNNTIAGLFQWSANSFDTWDARCSDAS